MINFTKEKFMSFYGLPSEAGASPCYDLVYRALDNLGILTDLTLIGAMATVRTEVGRSFLPIAESKFSGMIHKYGIKYRGRGYIQLTWEHNYKVYGDYLGIDLINNPDLAMVPENAAKILALYFKENGCDIACDQKAWTVVRRLVNGGTNGLDTFLSIVSQYQKVVAGSNINLNNKNMTKWVKFFTSNVAEYQTYFTETKTLQNDGETHSFTDAADALAKSTTEVFIFWDGEPMGAGTLAA